MSSACFHAARVALALLLTCVACSSADDPPLSGGGQTGGLGAGGAHESGGAAPLGGGDPGGGDPGEVHLAVLFVGNSYVYVNDLPNVVGALDEATPGVSLELDSVVKGGASLQDHWLTTGARSLIEDGAFDRVVLQGQSVEPITQPEVFQTHAALLAEAVRDAGGHPVWYATWARRAGDPWYDLEPMSTPAEMTAALDGAYQEASGGVEPVAHAGQAWQMALAAEPDLVLYADDGSHPSPAGTLLTAFVMFRALTGIEPELPKPPPLGVSVELASALQAVALGVSPCPMSRAPTDGGCI